MKTHVVLFSLMVAVVSTLTAGNPLLPHVYAADPSAHVWPGDDRIWLYTSHDEPDTNSHSTMSSYHVFSSRDLVSWTDHGRVFHLDNAPWAASHMWAIDAVLRNGKYHLIYCAQQKEGDGMFRTGVAVSDRPEGPFTDEGPIQGVDWGQDPALFVDDDNTPYLFWGAGGGCKGARLTEDLMSAVPGTQQDLSKQLTHVFEGPWVNKIKGRYYLTYPGLVDEKWPEKMFWATADKPLGPYTFGGMFMDTHQDFAGTNHGSVIEFDGKWIFFYHSSWLSGGKSEVRNLMADYLEFDDTGCLKMVKPTRQGAAARGATPGPSKVTILLEAETAHQQGGRHEQVTISTGKKGFSGRGYVEGFNGNHNRVTFLAQVAMDGEWVIKARYASREAGRYTLHVGPYEKNCDFPASDTFTEVVLGTFKLRAGDNRIQFSRFPRRDGMGILLDAVLLQPAKP